MVDEAPGVVSLHVGGRHLDRMGARAGQFFVWRFLDGPGWSRGNPYSLSAPVHGDLIRVTVKDLGEGSRRLAEVRPGTRVLVEGPYGALTADRRTRPRVTLIGAGIGITPLRAIAEDLDLPPGDVTLVHRAGDESDLVLRAETEELARARGIRLMHLVGPRAAGPARSWLPAHLAHLGDAEALRRIAPDIARQDVFVCGPDGWMATVEEALAAAGVPRARSTSSTSAGERRRRQMRRIVTALAGTVTALVMLFGYHTSTAGSGSPAAVPTGPVTTGSGELSEQLGQQLGHRDADLHG